MSENKKKCAHLWLGLQHPLHLLVELGAVLVEKRERLDVALEARVRERRRPVELRVVRVGNARLEFRVGWGRVG